MARAAKREVVCGERFGRLTVIASVDVLSSANDKKYLCMCDCGNVKDIWKGSLVSYGTDSCGCMTGKKLSELRRKHGKSRSGQYKAWYAMKNRCTNESSPFYKYYGGRGISVCDSWKNSFEEFLRDMGDRPEGCTLDRIDNNGNYCKENCRWATRKEQQRNRRGNTSIEFNGERMTLSGWAERLCVPRSVLASRVRLGWSIDRVLTEPVNVKYRNGRSKNGKHE